MKKKGWQRRNSKANNQARAATKRAATTMTEQKPRATDSITTPPLNLSRETILHECFNTKFKEVGIKQPQPLKESAKTNRSKYYRFHPHVGIYQLDYDFQRKSGRVDSGNILPSRSCNIFAQLHTGTPYTRGARRCHLHHQLKTEVSRLEQRGSHHPRKLR